MRILLGHTYYQQPGGEDSVFESEITLLEQNGHEVLPYVVRNDEVQNLNYLLLAKATFWNPRTYKDLSALIIRHRPTVAHFHNTFPLMSPSVYDACSNAGIPVVQTVHNYRFLCPAATFYRDGHICEACLKKSVKWPAIIHRCYRDSLSASSVAASMSSYYTLQGGWRKVTRFIAISQFVRQKLIEGGLESSRIAVKYNFVNDVREHTKTTKRGAYALFVGRLVPEKGIITLLNAWKSIGSHFPLKIAGDGPLAAEVKQASQQLPGVSYLGRKSQKEVADLMQRATFLVVPSEWPEPLGLVILEAYATATPVLGANIGGISELIKPGITGRHFKAGDPSSLKEAVEECLSSPEMLSRMGEQARHVYEREYSRAAAYPKLIDIYKLVQNDTKPPIQP